MTNIISFFRRNTSFQLKEEKITQKIGLVSIGLSLVIIVLIMSLFYMYAKQNRHKELNADGLTLTSMIAGHSLKELRGDNADKLLEIVNYIGSRSGLVYIIIVDTDQNIIAKSGSTHVDSPLMSERAVSSNNPLKKIYKDSRTNNKIYEFSRPVYRDGKKEGRVILGFSPDTTPLFSESDIRGILLVATLLFSLVPIIYYLVRGSLRLHALSMTDELTGLYNRRGFFILAEDYLRIGKRAGRGLMLLYADLDNLKEINDTLGHEEGDRLIKATADILKSTYRTSDIIARIGGDEFVAFPVGTDEDQVTIIANRLQENIAKFNAKNNSGYQLQISTGISLYKKNSMQSIDELLAQADDLMYKEKKSKHRARERGGLNDNSSTCTG